MKKILILDDEENSRESLKLILGDFFSLIIIDNEAQGIECVKNDATIELIFCNVINLKNTKFKFLQKVKEIRPKLTVVVLSNFKSVDIAEEAVRLGASGYFIKPFKSEELLAIARKI